MIDMTFTAELAKALVKAQGAMPKLIRDSKNPFHKNTYASLAAVIDTIRKPLADSGLALYQSATTATNDAGHPIVIVRSLLIHESGEYIEDELPMPVTKNDAQGIGSAITYGRRYAAMAMCGLAPDDDDGNEASGNQPTAQANGKAPKPQTKQLNPDAVRKVFHASGNELFGGEWDTLRSSVVKHYCETKTSGNIRGSSKELSTEELSALASSFVDGAGYWKKWLKDHMTHANGNGEKAQA